MLGFNKLRSVVAVLAVLTLLPVPGLEARNRKGDKLLKLGSDAEARQDFDQALEYYTQAVTQDPKDAGYQVAVRRVRFRAAEAHVEKGMKLKQEHQLEQALVEFQKAFNMDPGSAIAVQEIREVSEALDQQRKGKVPPGDAGLTSAERSRKESLAMIQSLQPVPELKPVSNQITSLKMNNQPPRVLYETVGKLAGINVLFDPQMQPGRNSNLDLSNVTLDEALDYIALLTKTYWKPISSNAIFVTEDNVTKRRDYEDEVVKVFYLKNPTSVQEFQEIVTGVRSVSDVRRMFTFNAQNAVMVRDTVDKVALVEKLFHDMDKAKSEVVIDVIVMEANSDVTRSLGAGLTSGSTNGLSIPLVFTPRNAVTQPATTPSTTTPGTTTPVASTPSGSSAVNLSRLSHLSSADFSTTLPGALLQAVMSDNNTKVLQSPEVRASDGQKVSLKIGDKVPYATGSFQPGIGTVGVSPLVSTQFQFAETGVNVEITPHVHGIDEMTLHVVIDISNVSNEVDVGGGLKQPVISQRKNEADIRLRDGEVSLLGGLMQTQDTNSLSGVPGLVNIPVLGKYLFGSTSKEKINRQLLIALIPHVVRSPDITDLDLRGIAAGTDQTVKLNYVKLNYAPRPEQAPPAASAPAGSTPAGSAPPAPSSAAPAPAAPALAAPAPAAPGSVTPPATPAAPPAPPPAGGPARILFAPGTVQTQLSSMIILGLQAENVTDLAAVPVKIRWDPKILRLERIAPGTLLIQDGNVTAPSLDIRNDTGDASVDINRVAGTAGVNGSGPLMVFQFTAVGKGSSSVSVSDVNLKDSKQQPISVTAPSVTVTVQ
jgi:general secretion pathway protein D